MLFDFFKKNKKSNLEIENTSGKSEEAFSGNTVDVSIADTAGNDEAIPSYQEDYSKAIFLWANAKKSQIKDNEDYPGYILYECGIRDAASFHRKMVEDGYLKENSFEASLESLKQTELKEIANELGLPVSGRKADVAKRIAESGNAEYLVRQMPATYSITDKGKAFVDANEAAVQIHRHKTWMIEWDEYCSVKKKQSDGTFYTVCNEILLERASVDKRLFGRIEYLSLSKLEEEFGDPRKSIRYLLQVFYIDVSGILGRDMYDSYKKGINTKGFLKDMFTANVMLAPGIIDQIKSYKEYYDRNIVDVLYSWKLPIMICEKQLFETMVNGILNGFFDYYLYGEQLKIRYERFIDQL